MPTAAHPDQRTFKPRRAFEAAVDQTAVKADRMTDQKRCTRGKQEHGEGGRAEGQRPEGQGACEHAAVPDGMDRVPDDAAGDGIASRGLDETIDRAGVV